MRTKLHYLIIGLLLGVFTLPVMATGQFMVGPYLRDITDNSVTLVWRTLLQRKGFCPTGLHRATINFRLRPRPRPSTG